MGSTNEWSQLKKVIVGVADYAKIPPMTKSLRCVNYADRTDTNDVVHGLYPQQVIDEANEDLEIFVDFLKGESIEVLRPERNDVEYYNYCPRDVLLRHGNITLAAPMSLEARQHEWKNYLKCAAPITVGERQSYDDAQYNENCIGDRDQLALNEHTPMFDAANVLRANDDLLYLVSNTGNKLGAESLHRLLNRPSNPYEEKDIRIHLLEGVYSYIHIDSTVAFLREGLMLLNPERIKDKSVLPAPFCDWDAIFCPEPVDIGYYGNYCNASAWINMNLLSINENLVCLEENQTNLAKELEKHGIESKLLPTRHQRTLGGGFHCVTCDLERL